MKKTLEKAKVPNFVTNLINKWGAKTNNQS